MRALVTIQRRLGCVLALSAFSSLGHTQELIPNGGFEQGDVPFCSAGYIPDPWFNRDTLSDTYSFDCAMLEGLAPTAFDNFTGLPQAFDGLRFHAGWSNPGLHGEYFGTPLVSTLVPNRCYRLVGAFAGPNVHTADGLYRAFLSADTLLDPGTDPFLGDIGEDAVDLVWSVDELLFTAPASAGSLPYLIIDPDDANDDSYIGTDGWSLTEIPGGSTYCVGAPNSVGPGASIGHSGSTSIVANDLILSAGGCPTGQFGLFYYGPGQTQTVFGNGFKCVDGPLSRLPLVLTDAQGIATQPIDYGNLPPNGQIEAGDTHNFQFWYRDPMGGGAFFNLSNALSLSFCP